MLPSFCVHQQVFETAKGISVTAEGAPSQGRDRFLVTLIISSGCL